MYKAKSQKSPARLKYYKIIVSLVVLICLTALLPISAYFSDTVGGGIDITLKMPIPQIQVIFGYTGGIQSYTVLHTGYYAIQVWGANGGAANGGGTGGVGGTCSGFVKLNAGDVVFVTVGGAGSGKSGGFSGGVAYTDAGDGSGVGTGGGGGTKIVLNSTNTGGASGSAQANDFLARAIMVAGGGGGGGSATKSPTGGKGGNVLPSGNGTNSTANGTDGGEGGLIGGDFAYTTGKGGTGTAGGAGGNSAGFRGDDGGPGYGGAANGSANAGGGGSGWYGGGGGAAASGGGGGGGSSFIRGTLNGFNTQALSTLPQNIVAACPLNPGATRPNTNGYCILTYLGPSV